MFLILVLFVCAFIAFYFYAKDVNNYWKKRGVDQVPTNLFFGLSFDILRGRSSLEQVYEKIYQATEPDAAYVGVYNIMKPVLFIRDPELFYQITVKDFSRFHERMNIPKIDGRLMYSLTMLEEEDWKDVRNKLIPSFSASKLKKIYGLIEECAELLVDQHFRPLAKSGKPIDVKEAMARFTLDVIGKCAFGLQFNTLNESDNLCRKVGKTLTDPGIKNTFRLILQTLHPNLLKLFGMKPISDEVENFFFDLLHGAEAVRRKESEHRGDFLQLMLDVKEESSHKSNHLFTENHIASNMFLFYFAGHETSAISMTFVLYELSLHSDIQEKLRQEIKKTLEANNGKMNYDTVMNMEYLEMVISETLRIHTPTPINSRLCNETYQVPGTSFTIKAGEQLQYSIAAVHKDEKYFPNPLKFDPERFSPENVSQISPYAYVPFGSGPRMCLGLRFAKLEMKICLASIISRFKFSRCSRTEEPIILKKTGIFHSPRNGVWLKVEEL